jgi:hypothetical protein
MSCIDIMASEARPDSRPLDTNDGYSSLCNDYLYDMGLVTRHWSS